jgi:hypothetical protein
MATLRNSAPITPPPTHLPTRLRRLWAQLPAPVREPLLCLLSQMLARHWRDGVKEGGHDDREQH